MCKSNDGGRNTSTVSMEIVPGNKASWQQPDSISRLNERQLQMHVVDFSRNHGGEAGTLHLIDKVCPKQAPGRIEHPGCSA